MPLEKDASAVIMPALKPLHGIRVENSVLEGTPDIAYIGGWIETKNVQEWPKRDTTKVRLPHYTAAQRAFARQHIALGGNCWLILKGPNLWLLFHGGVAAEKVGCSTVSELLDCSAWHCVNWDPKGFLKVITGGV